MSVQPPGASNQRRPVKWRPPEHYVHAGGDVVLVPARVAAWLMHSTRLRELRSQVRGADAEVDSVLIALSVAAECWSTSAAGSKSAPRSEDGRQWLSTTKASDVLGISARAVRLAIAEGRLEAENLDGRWRMTRDSVDEFAATRREHGTA